MWMMEREKRETKVRKQQETKPMNPTGEHHRPRC